MLYPPRNLWNELWKRWELPPRQLRMLGSLVRDRIVLIERLDCLVVVAFGKTSNSTCNDYLPHRQRYTGRPATRGQRAMSLTKFSKPLWKPFVSKTSNKVYRTPKNFLQLQWIVTLNATQTQIREKTNSTTQQTVAFSRDNWRAALSHAKNKSFRSCITDCRAWSFSSPLPEDWVAMMTYFPLPHAPPAFHVLWCIRAASCSVDCKTVRIVLPEDLNNGVAWHDVNALLSTCKFFLGSHSQLKSPR